MVSGDVPPIVLATTALISGGVWRHIEDLAGELRRSGHEVVYGLDPNAAPLRAASHVAGVPVFDFHATAGWRTWMWHVHLSNTVDLVAARAVVRRRLIGPTVLTEHLPRNHASDQSLLPGPRRPFALQAKTLFKRLEFACADAVISVSQSSANFLVQRYGVAHEKIHVVTNGIPQQPLPPPRTRSGGPAHVVSVGSVIHQKGHDILVGAARSGGKWRATIIGEGPMRASLTDLAAESALPVTFLGWRDDVSGILATADIACLPSRWESFPYAALEAMASGLPLVGTDVDGLRDLIEPELSGLVVPPDDPRALAKALDRLSSDFALCSQMGNAAYERASQFTVERMAAQTASVYDQVNR